MEIRSISIFLLLFAPVSASAQVIVSEIMYDLEGGDSDREWVEVQNTGSETITLTDWKLFENKTNHGITAIAGEALSPGAYAIIADDAAQFKNDWSSYTGLLFDSAFALNNTGETLMLRCCGKDLADRDSIVYASEQGGAGDGTSLHRSGATLVAAKPSPGTGAVVANTPLSPPMPMPAPPPTLPVQTPASPVPPLSPQPQQIEPTSSPPTHIPTSSAQPPLVVQSAIVETPQPVVSTQSNTESSPPKKKVQQKKPAVEVDEKTKEIEEKESTVPTAQIAAVPLVAPDSQDSWMWWGGALAISLLGAYGAFALGKAQGLRNEKEWEIEEIE